MYHVGLNLSCAYVLHSSWTQIEIYLYLNITYFETWVVYRHYLRLSQLELKLKNKYQAFYTEVKLVYHFGKTWVEHMNYSSLTKVKYVHM